MKVLIIGNGGREHALAWKAAQSSRVEKVFVAPGNAGTAIEDKIQNVDLAVEDTVSLLQFAKDKSIGLCIVGPEVPLVNGLVDVFQEEAVPCFGPSAAAAQLEGSKTFSKDFLARHGIPTAQYETFTNVEAAKKYVKEKGTPIVIKADGLAAGKGVVLAQTEGEALSAIEDMLSGNRFGQAGHQVVIEDMLQGEEASFIVMSDGENILPLASSQDHKARDNNDEGPNTGGMGAYSPAPVVSPAMHDRIMAEVIEPTIKGMSSEGRPFVGFLYAGIMVAPDGRPNVLEFNVRFGDPETQPIMMRLQSDLIELCLKALSGQLDQAQIKWREDACLGVVMASGGYPDAYEKGFPVLGLEKAEALGSEKWPIKVFHAGTRELNHEIVTDGGRVLCVCAIGSDIAQAQKRAYGAVEQIHWPDVYYRDDIGLKGIDRSN